MPEIYSGIEQVRKNTSAYSAAAMRANSVACRHRLAEPLLFVFPYQQI
jgi:hypothetical protein